MSSMFGQWLASKGWDVDDNPVYGRPHSVPWRGVEWVMLHHYAGSERAEDAYREAQYAKHAPGRFPPLCHLYQDVTGKVWVISQERPGQPVPGRASHAGRGSYPGIPTDRANEVTLGIEVQESGDSPIAAHPDRYERMIRLAADCLDYFDLPTSRLVDHDEYAGATQGKIDLLDRIEDLRRDVNRVRSIPVEQVMSTGNTPHRLDPHTMAGPLHDAIAKHKVGFVGLQETTDLDYKVLKPAGWDWFRPKRARSSTIICDPEHYRPVYNRLGRRVQGSFRVYRPWALDTPRYVVWGLFEYLPTGERQRIGVVHLPAFKTKNDKRAAAFRYAERRAARWLGRKGKRILLGDLNANKGKWTPNLGCFQWEKPRDNGTGPHGTHIDHVLKNWGKRPEVVATEDVGSDHRMLVVRL